MQLSPNTRQSLAGRLAYPLRQFAAYEPSSGILLVATAMAALAWANVEALPSYAGFWNTELAIRLGDWSLSLSVHDWIDDAVMTVFFLQISLEVKHEFARGSLSSWHTAVLPLAAAVGGMLVPVAIYLAFNAKGDAATGWAVPMATDVAFAIALLSLLGRRVPVGLRALLLALAVIDDIGTILVIALFYSSKIAAGPLLAAGGGLLLVWGMRSAGVRSFLPYWLAGAAIWLAMEKSGVHPTVAGVLLGLMTPLSVPRHRKGRSREAAARIPHLLRSQDTPNWRLKRELATAERGALAPLDILRYQLEPWVLYLIMPLFALANAGVELGAADLSADGNFRIFAGVALGLLVGKPLGILAFAWLAKQLVNASLPAGVSWPAMVGLGLLAGVGFTVALFLTSLAFPGQSAAVVARLGILAGSLAAAVIGLAILWWTLRVQSQPGSVRGDRTSTTDSNNHRNEELEA
ncbi:MAG: Na+/H+ antiporter NhaA [Salinisphaeraceae bacterium]|uniref:Na(+)/H(+) antiporter NhaA n=2 Tax=Spectribacter TaxID=3160928 RepID=A0ABU3C2J3_9GAMM|nr:MULTISPECIES: Na+/H+ antiporter NhaA [unclassified Salinisphaera]MDT0618394.1 Na+/H+ antiporter NhaA [Salinisphaera sp. P385]MDT0635752.1 Na+/H+ antiporter NhaA [Salinisphaera sp. W335]